MTELVNIPNYTGYMADKLGNIYSMIPKGCRDKFDKSKWLKKPKLLNYRITPTGYCRVYLRNDTTGKREDVYVHRIIASLFLPNEELLPVVNHKDCNPMNNSVDNLEWTTVKENITYALEYGNMKRNELGRFTHK